jgi:tRNA isopentenyl-2-thiomethyl-A-37 hydroxylase MiaE
VPFSTSQAGIIYKISKIDDNLHPKSCERKRLRVAKFLNRKVRLIHQMWDEMVTMIVIEKYNKLTTTSKVIQIDVEDFLTIRAPKKKKKEATIEEKKEKMIDNLLIKEYPKGLDKIECKHVDESIRSELSN